MENYRKRLRDFFNQQPNKDSLSKSHETDELIDDIVEDSKPDVEGIARELHQSHRRLWHKVEDELEIDFRPRLRKGQGRN